MAMVKSQRSARSFARALSQLRALPEPKLVLELESEPELE
jgi:hypothetical protein